MQKVVIKEVINENNNLIGIEINCKEKEWVIFNVNDNDCMAGLRIGHCIPSIGEKLTYKKIYEIGD
jgi:hypothetical protein